MGLTVVIGAVTADDRLPLLGIDSIILVVQIREVFYADLKPSGREVRLRFFRRPFPYHVHVVAGLAVVPGTSPEGDIMPLAKAAAFAVRAGIEEGLDVEGTLIVLPGLERKGFQIRGGAKLFEAVAIPGRIAAVQAAQLLYFAGFSRRLPDISELDR